MVTTTGGSRAASVVSNANARNTLKRRSKPYKLEEQKVVAKKRKLALQTSYETTAPKGYTFLAVGSPDLAELCKELSRKRSLPVNVVNAQPSSSAMKNPSKVSHHVHRIGYHFHSDVMEEACEKLGYVPYEGRFITLADLQQQRYDSQITKILAKHGMHVKANEESETQVRAAIKELFPKIPQQDLENIVTFAWQKGSKRVGEALEIPLARRVQLAVIARIRHAYTDYDALLRSFGNWQEVRAEVEPVTLQKLIEWRGEHGDEDDDLEEIVRETIVLDDDDEDDDDDAPITVESGSDESSDIEIVHRPAAEADLRAEETDERDYKYLRRYQQPQRPQKRTMTERNDIARQKISAARNALHNKSAPNGHRQMPLPNAQPIYAHPAQEPPRQVPVNGTWRVPIQAPAVAPRPYAEPELRDRPMQSIERDDDPNQPSYHPREPAGYRSRPITPPNERLEDPTRIVDLTLDSPRYPQPYARALPPQVERVHPHARGFYHGETVDLTSPRRVYEQPPAQPEVIRVVSGADGRYYVPAPPAQRTHAQLSERNHQLWRAEEHSVRGRYSEPTVPEYDPNQPLIDDRAGHRTAASSRYASPAQPEQRPFEYAPLSRTQQADQPQVMYQAPAPRIERPGQVYQAPMVYARPVPAPVHGAPAPIQQMPRELAYPQRPRGRTSHNTPVEHVVTNGSKPWYAESPLSREHYPR